MLKSVPADIVHALQSKTNSKVQDFSFISGGCINNGGRVTTAEGDYFLKWNARKKYPGMFAAEAKGLALLRSATSLKIPDVLFNGETEENQFLVLEFITNGVKNEHYWVNLGAGLAKLHRHTAPDFGLDHDNYIGSLSQDNTPSKSWVEFFIDRRLAPQLKRAVDLQMLEAGSASMFEKLFLKLHDLLPVEPPALLHGDLWAGNTMITHEGDPCLIDPAVYFGHREADLAMTALFGGFDGTFFEDYNEAYPLQPGYTRRVDIYNLYPLLVHVNLFGGGYGAQMMSIVKRFA